MRDICFSPCSANLVSQPAPVSGTIRQEPLSARLAFLAACSYHGNRLLARPARIAGRLAIEPHEWHGCPVRSSESGQTRRGNLLQRGILGALEFPGPAIFCPGAPFRAWRRPRHYLSPPYGG